MLLRWWRRLIADPMCPECGRTFQHRDCWLVHVGMNHTRIALNFMRHEAERRAK